MTATPPFSSYVAIGDSFTEGLMDFADPAHDPAGTDPAGRTAGHDRTDAPGRTDAEVVDPTAGGFRGWADRLAEQLVTSPAGSTDLTYGNLAIRGRLADQVLAEQLPRALELAPDLVSLCAGGNDCLRPYTNIDHLADEIESAVVALREAGIQVLMVNGYDTESASPLLRTVRSRVGIYNSHLWTIAQRHGCYMLDLWGLRELYTQEMWAEDRIHLSAKGHELVSRQALATLEGTASTRQGFAMPERPGRPVRQAVAEESAWVRTHLAPWVSRRLRRVSSGDGLEPKLPGLTPVRGEGD